MAKETESVTIPIKVLDEISKPLAAASKALGKLVKDTDRVEKETDGATKSQNKFKASLDRVRTAALKLRKAFRPLTTGVGALIGAFVSLRGAAQSIDLADRQIQAERALLAALDGRTIRTRELIELSKELQATTTIPDVELLEAETLLIRIGISAQEFPKALQASVDTAAALNRTLDFAARNIGRVSISGLSGELGEVVPEIRQLQREGITAEKVFAVLKDKFEGAAAALADTKFGQRTQAINDLTNAAEKLGVLLVDFVTPVLVEAGDALGKFTDAFDSPGLKVVVVLFEEFAAQLVTTAAAAVGLLGVVGIFSALGFVLGPVVSFLVLIKVGLLAIVGAAAALGTALLGSFAPLVGILAVMGLVVAAITDIEATFEGLKSVIFAIGRAIGRLFAPLVEQAREIGARLSGAFSSFAEGKLAAKDLFKFIGTEIKVVQLKVNNFFTNFTKFVKAQLVAIGAVFGFIGEHILRAFDTFVFNAKRSIAFFQDLWEDVFGGDDPDALTNEATLRATILNLRKQQIAEEARLDALNAAAADNKNLVPQTGSLDLDDILDDLAVYKARLEEVTAEHKLLDEERRKLEEPISFPGVAEIFLDSLKASTEAVAANEAEIAAVRLQADKEIHIARKRQLDSLISAQEQSIALELKAIASRQSGTKAFIEELKAITINPETLFKEITPEKIRQLFIGRSIVARQLLEAAFNKELKKQFALGTLTADEFLANIAKVGEVKNQQDIDGRTEVLAKLKEQRVELEANLKLQQAALEEAKKEEAFLRENEQSDLAIGAQDILEVGAKVAELTNQVGEATAKIEENYETAVRDAQSLSEFQLQAEVNRIKQLKEAKEGIVQFSKIIDTARRDAEQAEGVLLQSLALGDDKQQKQAILDYEAALTKLSEAVAKVTDAAKTFEADGKIDVSDLLSQLAGEDISQQLLKTAKNLQKGLAETFADIDILVEVGAKTQIEGNTLARDAAEDYKESLQKLLDLFEKLKDETGELPPLLEVVHAQIKQIQDQVKAPPGTFFDAFSESAEQAVKDLANTIEAGEKIGASFVNGLSGAVDVLLSKEGNLQEFFDNFLRNIAAAIIKLLLFKAIQGALGLGGEVGSAVGGAVAGSYRGGLVTGRGAARPGYADPGSGRATRSIFKNDVLRIKEMRNTERILQSITHHIKGQDKITLKSVRVKHLSERASEKKSIFEKISDRVSSVVNNVIEKKINVSDKDLPHYAFGGIHFGAGTVKGPSVRRDIINAKLMPKEYVQPVDSVDYYGVKIMNLMRMRAIPKELFEQYLKGATTIKEVKTNFATGGQATAPAAGGSSESGDPIPAVLIADRQTAARLLRQGKRTMTDFFYEAGGELFK